MNTLDQIRELRSKGYSVKITHERVPIEWAVGFMNHPRGGATHIEILTPDESAGVTGIARCSKRDNYCKRIGRDIAFGRALKALKEIVKEID